MLPGDLIPTVRAAIVEPMQGTRARDTDPRLARRLVVDELFDLSLYERLRDVAPPDLRGVLEQLIPIEAKHFRFWQQFFDVHVARLDAARRIKLGFLVAVCRVFGAPAIHLVLEAIEVYGVRKYLDVWDRYGDGPLGPAVRSVLDDEFRHEDAVVMGDAERRIHPERVRNVFLGLNDGLVEILGAVSGFFGAFGNTRAVLAASVTVAVAGAFSMAAGAWVATSSAAEVERTERRRRRFLGESNGDPGATESPLSAAAVVGASYFAGAVVPVLPVGLGASSVLLPAITAGLLIIVVSALLAFLTGMAVRRRIAMNLVIIAAAVGVTYAIGLATKAVWGITV
jgi:vacuolar iron transporter family protein